MFEVGYNGRGKPLNWVCFDGRNIGDFTNPHSRRAMEGSVDSNLGRDKMNSPQFARGTYAVLDRGETSSTLYLARPGSQFDVMAQGISPHEVGSSIRRLHSQHGVDMVVQVGLRELPSGTIKEFDETNFSLTVIRPLLSKTYASSHRRRS